MVCGHMLTRQMLTTLFEIRTNAHMPRHLVTYPPGTNYLANVDILNGPSYIRRSQKELQKRLQTLCKDFAEDRRNLEEFSSLWATAFDMNTVEIMTFMAAMVLLFLTLLRLQFDI